MEEREITGIKDVDLKILMEMDDRELLTICNSKNKYFYRICKNDVFWHQRYIKRFASIKKESLNYKPNNQTWKQYYLQAVIDLDRFSSDPWEFLKYILWSKDGPEFSKYKDDKGEVYPFEEAPGWVMNNFFLLNLGPVKINEKYHSFVTPEKIFELLKKYAIGGLLLSGRSIYQNKDVYQNNIF